MSSLLHMLRRPIKEISAEFTAEEKSLPGIQRTVREACAGAGLSRRDATSVQLAIEEGATNVIRHAYLYRPGTILIRIAVYRQLIVFSLIDSGRSFQPQGRGRLNLDRLVETGRKGGLGFYMIQKIMDSVEYIAASGTNELRMIKRIGEQRGHNRPLLRRLITLRVKFSFWTFLIVLIIIGAAYYYLDTRTSRHLYAHLDGTVTALAKTVADQAAGYAINRRSDVEFDELTVSYLRANPELEEIVLTDSSGLIMAHSTDARMIRKPYRPPTGINETAVGAIQRRTIDGVVRRHLVLPIRTGGVGLGMVHVTYSAESIRARIVQARWRIALLTAVLLAFGVVGIYFLSNYFVRPIVKITQRVRRFASGDLKTELPLEGAEEFFEISRAFNAMMTRLNHDRRELIAREKLAKEVEVASQIQKTLLPRELPTVAGLELQAFYRAAEAIGGDLYDVFPVGEGRFCLAVADVSGKGVPASLVMSVLRTNIRILAVEGSSARETLVKVNKHVQGNIPAGMFITVLLMVFDCSTQKVTLASAGHNPMLLFRAEEGTVNMINPPGMPLGMPMTPGVSFADGLKEETLVLKRGDGFIIYSDGVTEAADRNGERYGVERLAQLLAAEMADGAPSGVTGLRDRIVSELQEFSGFDRVSDDITFIVGRATALSTCGGDEQHSQASREVVETRRVERVRGH